MKLLHLADVHVGAKLTAFGDVAASRVEAVLEEFRQLPDRAREHGVHAVLVAGDLFDGTEPSREHLAAVRDTFRRLVEAQRPVFVVPGNHDSATFRPNPYKEDLGGATLFTDPAFGEPETVETAAGPLNVYGLCYDPAVDREPLAAYRRADRPGPHVVLLHGAVRFAPHWGDSASSLRLELERLAALDADYIALGDYHSFRPPMRFDAAGSIPACYPGSFAAVDLTETGPRGYAVVTLGEGSPEVRHHASRLPAVHDLGAIDVSRAESETEIADLVAEKTPERCYPVVTLTGEPGFPLDTDTVRIELCERLGFAVVRDGTRFYSAGILDELAEQDTVVGHVVRLGRRRIQRAPTDSERETADRALRIVLRELEAR